MTDLTQIKQADWQKVEDEVVEKIRALRDICQQSKPSPLMDKIANEMILPCVALLGQFCVSVKIEEEDAQ